MNKVLFILFIVFNFCFNKAVAAEFDTLDNQIKIRYLVSPGVYRWGLAKYPSNYLTEPAKKFKAMIFLHGSGEAGSGEAGLPNLSVNSIPYFFKQGTMGTAHYNYKTSQTEEMIFISLQMGTGGLTMAQLWYAIDNSPNLARIDKNNISLIGLSLGSRVISRILKNGREDTLARARSIILMSSPNANDGDVNTEYTLTQPGGLTDQQKPIYQIWSLSDNTGGTVASWNTKIMNAMETYSPTTYAKKNYSGGHCCWNTQSAMTNRQMITTPYGTFNMNIVEWSLVWSVDTPDIPIGPNDPIFQKQRGKFRLKA